MDATLQERFSGYARKFWNETVLGNTDDAGKRPAPVDAANEVASMYGLHSLLKYDQFDETTGLFFNEGSVSFCFEVLAQTGADEDMASRLNTLFTPVPPGFGIQWCLFGSPMLDEKFEDYLTQRRGQGDHHAVLYGVGPEAHQLHPHGQRQPFVDE